MVRHTLLISFRERFAKILSWIAGGTVGEPYISVHWCVKFYSSKFLWEGDAFKNLSFAEEMLLIVACVCYQRCNIYSCAWSHLDAFAAPVKNVRKRWGWWLFVLVGHFTASADDIWKRRRVKLEQRVILPLLNVTTIFGTLFDDVERQRTWFESRLKSISWPFRMPIQRHVGNADHSMNKVSRTARR